MSVNLDGIKKNTIEILVRKLRLTRSTGYVTQFVMDIFENLILNLSVSFVIKYSKILCIQRIGKLR